ncbi:MAG: 4-hydroxy-tetrahydrodipicolinate reductase [PS1 clade bacterium]|uniref:4-hydroxy-tetrahydrodipicolinate reductase n=1 Tax=PS1 clade bacterium TaxID=2175152 RepID=A0A937HE68_9PROT|nr:4-hydroxy-tetrahydrodipicolinate reductase [PS1 clade bacterium]
MSKMKLIVNGCAGRMGQALTRLISAHDALQLLGGLEVAGSDALGQDLGALAGGSALGVSASDDALALMAEADGVIDFTTPAASAELAGLAAQARIVHIIGSTGFDAAQQAAIEAAARHATIVKSGNMSLGVNVLAGLVKQAAAQLGDAWDIEIVEMHHRHKVDAPSGTALLLGDAAAQGRDVTLDAVKQSGRDGIGAPRADGAIGFAALRGGSVVGDHEVILATQNEQLRLAHRAEDRDIFARGAIEAALWAKDKPHGLYTMQDVLGL